VRSIEFEDYLQKPLMLVTTSSYSFSSSTYNKIDMYPDASSARWEVASKK